MNRENMTNEFYNQTITAWAKKDLKHSFYADHQSRLPLYGLSAFLLLLPALLIYGGISNYFRGGDSETTSRFLEIGIGGFVLFGAGVVWLVFFYWRVLLETLDKDGVEISSGRRFLWNDFQYVNEVLVTRRRGGGKQFLRYELVFGDGKALIPADLKNIGRIEVLMALMRAERRINGKIRQ